MTISPTMVVALSKRHLIKTNKQIKFTVLTISNNNNNNNNK